MYINMNCTMISCHSNIPGAMTSFPNSLFPTDFPSVSPFGKDGVGNFFHSLNEEKKIFQKVPHTAYFPPGSSNNNFISFSWQESVPLLTRCDEEPDKS